MFFLKKKGFFYQDGGGFVTHVSTLQIPTQILS